MYSDESQDQRKTGIDLNIHSVSKVPKSFEFEFLFNQDPNSNCAVGTPAIELLTKINSTPVEHSGSQFLDDSTY